jgi:hypothetical protein
MARIRTIKPEFWDSEQISECSTNARLLFIGIWNFCDDRGVIEERPKQIKGQIFRFDDVSVRDLQTYLGELLHHDLLRRMTDGDGKSYLYVPTWKKHQKIDRPQKKFNNPVPPEFDESSTNDQPELPYDSSNTHRALAPRAPRKGREGKGVERNLSSSSLRSDEDSAPALNGAGPAPPPRIATLSENWTPSEAQTAFAVTAGFTEPEVRRQAAFYRAYWTTGGGAGERRSSKGWNRTWQTWMRKEADRHQTRAAPTNGAGRGRGRPVLSEADIDEVLGPKGGGNDR